MKSFLLAAAVSMLTAPVALAESWGVDPSHTEVLVSWNHAGFSIQSAKFDGVSGSMDFTPGDVAGMSADFTVQAATVTSGVEMFDGHLKSGDFFDVENHPEIRFVSTSAEQTGDMSASVVGDMTIKGVTQPVTFDVTVHALGEHPVGQFFDAYKGEWLGFTAVANIKRSDFGIDTFIPVGSDEVTITINTEMRAGGFSF